MASFNQYMYNTRAKSHGFTLIEILIVLLIMGMCVGLASAVIRPDQQATLGVEAERLAQLLDITIEESNLSGKSYAWTADKTGYRFWRLSKDNEWREPGDNDLLRARALPPGMTISSLQINNEENHRAMRLEFTPYNPVPAFSINMVFGNAHHTITASPIGEIQVLAPERVASEKFAKL